MRKNWNWEGEGYDLSLARVLAGARVTCRESDMTTHTECGQRSAKNIEQPPNTLWRHSKKLHSLFFLFLLLLFNHFSLFNNPPNFATLPNPTKQGHHQIPQKNHYHTHTHHHHHFLLSTMEEVWKDINLATLNDQVTTTHSNFGGVILQDFLARPFTIEPPNTILSSQTPSLYAAPSSPAPPLLTALSLSSHPHLHFDPHTHKPHHHPPPPSNHPCFAAPTTASLGAKRFAEPDCNLGDRRNKRMIKNRESAARSRARKQEKFSFTFALSLIFPTVGSTPTILGLTESSSSANLGRGLKKKKTASRG